MDTPLESNSQEPNNAAIHATPVDREQFVRLLIKNDRKIRAYLRSLLPTANDVDEVMQEVSVVAWRKFENLDAPENFARWVCVVARYEVLMYRRKKARDRLVLSDDLVQVMAQEGIEELSRREEQLEALESCLSKLPDERKRLVLKVYSAESPMKMIAKQEGKTPDALYKILSRVRRELMKCIEHRVMGEAR